MSAAFAVVRLELGGDPGRRHPLTESRLQALSDLYREIDTDAVEECQRASGNINDTFQFR